jgi:putative ABC transport system substrate-binding protein
MQRHRIFFRVANFPRYTGFFCSGAIMRRRDFLGTIGCLAFSQVDAVGQPALPAIGYLSTLSEAQVVPQTAAFRRGLAEVGFSEGQNVAIEFRWAEGRYDRLPAMASELVRRPVSLIVAQAPPAALAAKAATVSIPVVFVVGFDPVGAGLVASLNKPGGNATGMTLVSPALGQKRLEVLREIVPQASTIALLVNPLSPDTAPEIASVQAGAQALHIQLAMFTAGSAQEIESAFRDIANRKPDALIVGTDPLLLNKRDDIVKLAATLKIPAIYPFRDYTKAGGLMSYGTNIANSYRQAGIYAGRILKGDKPGDLPVMQPTAFEMVINLRAAAAIGIDIPATLHVRSDEIIE